MTKELHINVVIRTLIESSTDKNESVTAAIRSSLYKIANKYPNEVLRTACDYLQKNKLAANQTAVLLQIMAHISQEHIVALDGDVVLTLIGFCISEMTKNGLLKSSEVELNASDVLVALGKEHSIQVMESLIKKFEPGTVPHYTVVHTMGSLAIANCYGTVPYIKSVMTNMLPLLGSLKSDHLKQSFAYAIGNFSCALTEYIANIDKAPDPTLDKETFSTEMTVAYDIIVTWLHSREPKVVESILQAIGALVLILPVDKIKEQIPKLVPNLLSTYKKFNEPFVITKCLCSVIVALTEKNKQLLEPVLDNLLNSLLDHVSISPDYISHTDTLKNNSEVLRCYDNLGTYFPDKIIDYLSQQLKNNNESVKIKALTIVSHMINSSDQEIKKRLNKLVVILKTLLNDPSIKVKKVMLKIIVLLAYHNFLEGDDINLFLNYIIKLCNNNFNHEMNNKTEATKENVDNVEFKRLCDNSLYLLTTSVPQLEEKLWPLFLQNFLNREFSEATYSVTRCLSHLASKVKEQQTSEKTISESPDSASVFVRCLALLSSPLLSYRGTYVLNFLKNYILFVDERLTKLWETKIDEMIKYLEENCDDFDQIQWENLVMNFLSTTVEEISEPKWKEVVTKELELSINSYAEFCDEKNFLFICLATIINHIHDRATINNKLDLILSHAKSHSDIENQICSRAIGICADQNLEMILPKLRELWSNEAARKPTKFFGLMKDSKHDNTERIKLTLLYCYWEIASNKKDNTVAALIDNDILKWTVEQLKSTKDFHVRKSALMTITSIVDIMHTNKANLSYAVEDRDGILFTVLDLLQDNIQLYPVVFQAATSLIKLPPTLKTEQKTQIFKICFENVSSKNKLNHAEINDNLILLIQEILLQSVSPMVLEEIFCLLQMWLSQTDQERRYAALKVLKSVLECYLVNVSYDSGSVFELTGFIIGCLIPKCSDPNMEARREAIDCIELVSSIASKYEGHIENSLEAKVFSEIKTNIQTNNQQLLMDSLAELAKVISNRMPHYQLVNFIENLLTGLLDTEPNCSNGVANVLNVFFKIKGGDLFHHVDDVMSKIIFNLEKISDHNTKVTTLNSVVNLASHHPKAVITSLLMQPLDNDSCISECWRVLSEDKVLAAAALNHFSRLFGTTNLYDEQPGRELLRIATHQPLAAISALSDMFRWAHMEEIALSQFAEIFTILFVSVTCYIGVSAPVHIPQQSKDKDNKFSVIPNRNAYKLNPAKIALDAFKSFLLCAKCERVAEALLLCSRIEREESVLAYIEVMPKITENVCIAQPNMVPKIITNLSHYRTSTYEIQRIAVAAFYAEFIHQKVKTDTVLLESVITSLLEGQTDSCATVRQLSLRGLGYIPSQSEVIVSRHCSSALNAFMNGLDDHKMSNDMTKNTIPLEAMIGLSNILHAIDEDQLNSIQVNVGMRIKQFFENDDAVLRATSIKLFGDLVNSCKKTCRQNTLKEQINGNLICLLLHLSDTDADVVKACKYSLRVVGPLLEANKVNAMIQDHLIDDANLQFSDFMMALVKVMGEELSELIPFLLMSALAYIKSYCPEIRGNTAAMIGLLYSNMPKASENQKSLDSVCHRLVQLLKDPDSNVRAKTAYALGNLFSSAD